MAMASTTRARGEGAGDPAHPVTQGFLCGKVAQYLERVYSPERLLYPMRRRAGRGRRGRRLWGRERPRGGGVRADRLGRGAGADCGEADGDRGGVWAGERAAVQLCGDDWAAWVRVDGPAIFSPAGGVATGANDLLGGGRGGAEEVYGVKLGTAPEDFAHAGLVIAWGANIHGNNIHLWPFIEEARRKGARLVVIDPYRTRTAAVADEHLAIRPGTDIAAGAGDDACAFPRGAGGCGVYGCVHGGCGGAAGACAAGRSTRRSGRRR